MQNNLATPPFQPNTTGRMALLKRFVVRHPYLGALLLLVYWLAMILGLGRLFGLLLLLTHIHLSALAANALGEILMVGVVLLPIWLLGWWSEVGITRGINGRGIVVLLLPFLLVCGPVLLILPGIAVEAPLAIIVLAIALSLLVACAEEGMFRGLILRTLLPGGIWPAVLLSSLCFASVHITNLLVGVSWGYVVQQLMLAFGSGVLFASIRLRTGSLWSTIALHMLRDVGGLILLGINPATMNVPLTTTGLIVNGFFCALFLLNALVLLRPSQVRKLNVSYGLVPPPAPVPAISPFGYPSQPYPPQQSMPPFDTSQPYPYPYPPQQPTPPFDYTFQLYPPQQPVPPFDYTSPQAYGEQPGAGTPAPTPPRDGEH